MRQILENNDKVILEYSYKIPTIWDLVYGQLKVSKSFHILVILFLFLFPLSLFYTIFIYLIEILGGIIVTVSMLALATGIHEHIHLKTAEKLKLKITDVRVNRIGDINYGLYSSCPEKAVVAKAPYVAIDQYILLVVWITIYVFLIYMCSNIIVEIIYIFLLLVPIILLISSLSTLRFITSKNTRSLSYKIALLIGSKDDLEEIRECYHKNEWNSLTLV